jgi:DNA-binding response OmpR family regulator
MAPDRTVIIADDNPQIREILTDTLVDMGYKADSVGDGYELLAYLESNNPSVIILDMMMPEKSGASIFDTIKQMSPFSRIIIYTGHVEYSTSIYARRADRFLVKGANLDELLEAVKELA